MLGAIIGLYSEAGVRLQDERVIDVSFPAFRELLAAAADAA
jgi:5-enolpyruvylshikimate-3-phosphate synthase